MSVRHDLAASSACGAIAGVAVGFVALAALAMPAEATATGAGSIVGAASAIGNSAAFITTTQGP